MPSIKRLLGARLRQIREEQHLRADDVAAWVGVDRTHLYSCERGAYWPSVELLTNLATAYHVDVADLWAFPSEHPRQNLRDLVRRLPNAKLAAATEFLEELLAHDKAKPETPRKKTAR